MRPTRPRGTPRPAPPPASWWLPRAGRTAHAPAGGEIHHGGGPGYAGGEDGPRRAELRLPPSEGVQPGNARAGQGRRTGADHLHLRPDPGPGTTHPPQGSAALRHLG